MPELPEVETTRRSLEPGMIGRKIMRVVVRDRRLRWPVPADLESRLSGATVTALRRRAKYLLVDTDRGSVMVHLGMSGSLRIVPEQSPAVAHDHIDFVLDDRQLVRYHDPRRFGSVHWLVTDAGHPLGSHALLEHLAPEPLDGEFDGTYLYGITRARRAPIKQIIMNGTLVTGVGNIYASEALHLAGIHPRAAAHRLSRARCDRLAAAIKATLRRAIDAGGSSLRDYVNGTGDPGHFQLETAVYDRGGQPCRRCGGIVRMIRQGQRATYYCPACQH